MNAAIMHMYYAQKLAQIITERQGMKQMVKADGIASMTTLSGHGRVTSHRSFAVMV